MANKDDFLKREGEDVAHLELIGGGGYGEVHKVFNSYQSANSIDARRKNIGGTFWSNKLLTRASVLQGN